MKNNTFIRAYMKIYKCVTISFFFIFSNLVGQSANENYVYTRLAFLPINSSAQMDTLSDQNTARSVIYSDGMGRTMQTVAIKGSASKKDIVKPQFYDNLGRNSKDYLPYVTTISDGTFRNTAITDQISYFRNVNRFIDGFDTSYVSYAESKFEASPLNRIQEQGQVGTVWRVLENSFLGRTVKNFSRGNLAGEVRKWNPDGTSNGTYAANDLIVTEIEDENRNISLTFTDKSGKTILKKSTLDMESVCTYYVYDNNDNLKFIIPPEAYKVMLSTGQTVNSCSPIPQATNVNFGQGIIGNVVNGEGDPPTDPCSGQPFSFSEIEVSCYLLNQIRLSALLMCGGTINSTVINCEWKIGSSGTVQSFSDQRINLLNRALDVTSLNLVKGQSYSFYIKATNPSNGATTGWSAGITFTYDYSIPFNWDITQELKDKWVTEFWYDNENRLIKKKLPEKNGYIEFVYDQLGRVVLSRDPLLKTVNKWTFSKYDQHGRVILTGIYTDVQRTDRDVMQAYVDTYILTEGGNPTGKSFYESRNTDPLYHYYTPNNAFPDITLCDVWSVSYYDDYNINNDNQGAPDFNFISDNEFAANVQLNRLFGYPTFTKTRILTNQQSGGALIEGNVMRVLPEYRSPSNTTITYSPSNPSGLPVSEYYTGGQWLTSCTFYDKYGRVIQVQSTNALGGQDVQHILYDFAGKTLKAKKIHTTSLATVTVVDSFAYNHLGQVIRSYQKNNSDARVILAQFTYNEFGELIKKEIHSTNNGSSFLQAVDFKYNIRGWLKQVNDPNNLGSDKFAMQLNYDVLSTGLPGTARFDGTITQQVWATGSTKRGYGYTYDASNQLVEAAYGEGTNFGTNAGRYSEQVTYDLNGNIQSLRRSGKINWASPSYGWMDRLKYYYSGNKLLAVHDTVPDITNNGKYDFSDNGNEGTIDVSNMATHEYKYDDNGNLITDRNKGIQSITYNYLNLPEVIDFGGNNKIQWKYSASGAKLSKTVYTAGNVTLTIDYVSGFVYRNTQLDYFFSETGRVKKTAQGTFRYEYDLSDHLGNTRISFADTNADMNADVLQEVHYYAFGMRIEGLGTVSDNKFLFNGKELTDDFGLQWYEYGWRMYDPQLGRWHRVDPVDELLSPYCYVGNDPINNIDPDGRFIGTIVGGLIGGVSSLAHGEDFGKGFIAGAMAGAVFDAAVFVTVSTGGTALAAGIIAGSLAGATASVSDQLLDNGRVDSWEEVAVSTVFGGALGPLSEMAVGALGNGIGRLLQRRAVVEHGAFVFARKIDDIISTRIRGRKQLSEHTKGGKKLGENSYLNSVDEAAQVLDATHAGETKILSTNIKEHRVYVQYNKVTGYYNNNGIIVPTNKFLIKGSGKNGATVVPVHPNTKRFK